MSRKGNYYTPAAQLSIVPGVQMERCAGRVDVYIGEAKALEDSGLLRAEMLPAPGRYSMTWRPEGCSPKPGESWCCVPGYMQVRLHPSGRFHVTLVVAEEEQAKRRAALARREAERKLQCAAEHQAREAQRTKAPQRISGSSSEEDFRYGARVFAFSLRKYLIEGVGDGGPFSYSLDDDDLGAVEEALDRIDEAVAAGTLATNRAKAAQLEMQQKGDAAHADMPLQAFLALVGAKGKRRKSA